MWFAKQAVKDAPLDLRMTNIKPRLAEWCSTAFEQVSTCKKTNTLAWKHLDWKDDEFPALEEEAWQRHSDGTLFVHGKVEADDDDDGEETEEGEIVDHEDEIVDHGDGQDAPLLEAAEAATVAKAALSKSERLFYLRWCYGKAPPK